MFRRFVGGVTLLLCMCGTSVPQGVSPADFWQRYIRRPLTGPMGGDYFQRSLKGALVPGGAAPYLQGTLVSITPGNTNPRRLMLSMEGTGVPDAAIVLANRNLKTEPQKEAVIRFEGVPMTFTKEPFMVTFEIEDAHMRFDVQNPQ